MPKGDHNMNGVEIIFHVSTGDRRLVLGAPANSLISGIPNTDTISRALVVPMAPINITSSAKSVTLNISFNLTAIFFPLCNSAF